MPFTRKSHPTDEAPLTPSAAWNGHCTAPPESTSSVDWEDGEAAGAGAGADAGAGAGALERAGNATDVKRATFPRASRAARPSDPASLAKQQVANAVRKREAELLAQGCRKAPKIAQAFRTHRAAGSGSNGGKGPGFRGAQGDRHRINHLASIKAKGIDANNTEPAFLLGGYTAPMTWERLAASAFKANAVSSSQMGRKKTESATPQWVCALGTTPPQLGDCCVPVAEQPASTACPSARPPPRKSWPSQRPWRTRANAFATALRSCPSSTRWARMRSTCARLRSQTTTP